jgi:universal stress protein A
MLSYKKILVACDLSETNRKILVRAGELASQCKADLNAIHVIEFSPFAYAGEFSATLDPNIEQSLVTSAQTTLNELCEEFTIAPDHQYIERGSVKLVVSEMAEQIHADLIVVGSHSHHGLEVLLGSRANAILHAAKCDVYVVRIKE